jgi:hypothetical protein
MNNSNVVNFDDLDFRAVIEAHMEWEVRLRNFIEGKGKELLTVEFIEKDNNCILGKWIYNIKDEKLLNTFEFKLLRSIHACFHLQAAEVLKSSIKGNKQAALALLDSGDYTYYSDKVKLLLTKLHLSQY